MQRHLKTFVEILVVHIMNAIHRMHIGLREPLHHGVELGEDLVVIEIVARHGQSRGGNLLAGDLVSAAIDGIKKAFCQVHARTEELHLLAEAHGRHATGDAVVVAPEGPHEIVVLVLEGRRIAADLDAVAFERLREVLRPEHGDVRLRSRPEIGERVQHAVAAPGHQAVPVQIHAADTLGRPVRIAAEQRIVFRRAQEADDAEFLDKLIPKLLRSRFIKAAFAHIALDIDVEEA